MTSPGARGALKQPKQPKRNSAEREAKLPDENRKHLARVLQRYLDEHHGGNQTDFAREVGVPPGTINQLLSASGTRGAGIVVLMRLRNYMRVSIDELIGLEDSDPLGRGERLTRQMIREEVDSILATRRERGDV